MSKENKNGLYGFAIDGTKLPIERIPYYNYLIESGIKKPQENKGQEEESNKLTDGEKIALVEKELKKLSVKKLDEIFKNIKYPEDSFNELENKGEKVEILLNYFIYDEEKKSIQADENRFDFLDKEEDETKPQGEDDSSTTEKENTPTDNASNILKLVKEFSDELNKEFGEFLEKEKLPFASSLEQVSALREFALSKDIKNFDKLKKADLIKALIK